MNSTTLNQWGGLVQFLGHVLGDQSEILLETQAEGIVTSCGGQLLGHRPGMPMTPCTAKLISDQIYLKEPIQCSNEVHPKTGNPLRRYSYFILDEDRTLFAVLTVISDISNYLAVIETLSQLIGQQVPFVKGMPVDNREKRGAVNSALIEMGLSHVEPHRLTEQEVVDLVRILAQRGVFEAKGSVSEIAKQLKVSESTVYRHLTYVTRHQKDDVRDS